MANSSVPIWRVGKIVISLVIVYVFCWTNYWLFNIAAANQWMLVRVFSKKNWFPVNKIRANLKTSKTAKKIMIIQGGYTMMCL